MDNGHPICRVLTLKSDPKSIHKSSPLHLKDRLMVWYSSSSIELALSNVACLVKCLNCCHSQWMSTALHWFFPKKPPPMTINENVKLAPSPFSSTQPHSHVVFAQREPIFLWSLSTALVCYTRVFYKLWKRQGLKKCMKIVDVMA